jgi:hypothetical protein
MTGDSRAAGLAMAFNLIEAGKLVERLDEHAQHEPPSPRL